MIYRTTHKPDHPRADSLGFVKVHILVAEEILGRSLQKGEVVHHRDWNRLNNAKDNLHVMTRAEHQNIPYWQGKFLREKNLLSEFFEWWEDKQKEGDKEYEAELEIAKLQESIQRRTARINRKEGKEEKEVAT